MNKSEPEMKMQPKRGRGRPKNLTGIPLKNNVAVGEQLEHQKFLHAKYIESILLEPRMWKDISAESRLGTILVRRLAQGFSFHMAMTWVKLESYLMKVAKRTGLSLERPK